MMTCDSCGDRPLPSKRARNTSQPQEWPAATGDAGECLAKSGACDCSRVRRLRAFRRPANVAPTPASIPLAPPAFTLNLSRTPAVYLKQSRLQTMAVASGEVHIGRPGVVNAIDVHELYALLNKRDDVLVVDSRFFIDYNTCHIQRAVNVANSKIGKRRLEQDRVSVRDLLVNNCDLDSYTRVVVYDANSKGLQHISTDSFIAILLDRLSAIFDRVSLLNGGFNEFHSCYPEQCEDKQRPCAPLASALSQPCMPISNVGPTRILPFLYLGSQMDAHNRQLLWEHNITYVLNVSASCPKADFIPDNQFLRIAVNDNYSEKLLPHFSKAFHFLDRVRESSGCVLVHCLAGVSRSPTMAIAYVMKHLRMSSDDAYRYVKSKRPTISPNFNFLGQLLEYEKQLRREKVIDNAPDICSSAPILPTRSYCAPMAASCAMMSFRERDVSFVSQKKQRLCGPRMRLYAGVPKPLTLSLNLPMETVKDAPSEGNSPADGAVSPTTGISRLNFGSGQENVSMLGEHTRPFDVARSLSCDLDFRRVHEDENLPPTEVERILSLSPCSERPRQLLAETGSTGCSDVVDGAESAVELRQAPAQDAPAMQMGGIGGGVRRAATSRDSLKLAKTLSGSSIRRSGRPLLRSDSGSTNATSGYGSQISEQPDMLDDEMSDPDEPVLMRDQTSGGGAGNVGVGQTHRKVTRHDSAYRSMVFEEGLPLAPREIASKVLGSPLSPSEQHLVEDFDAPAEGGDNTEVDELVLRAMTGTDRGGSASRCRSHRIIDSSASSTTRFMASTGRPWRNSSGDFETSDDSGIDRSSMTSSSRNSLISSMRSSVMSSSITSSSMMSSSVMTSSTSSSTAAAGGSFTRFSEVEVYSMSALPTTSPEHRRSAVRGSRATGASCKLSTDMAVAASRMTTDPAMNRFTPAVTGPSCTLLRARSLPGLDAIRAPECPVDVALRVSGRSSSKPRNRHSYSGAVDLANLRDSVPPPSSPQRMSITVN